MTATIVSLALILTPSPLTAPKEAPQWSSSSTTAFTMPSAPTVAVSYPFEALLFESTTFKIVPRQISSAPIEMNAMFELPTDAPDTKSFEPEPLAPPPIPPTPIEATLNRLSELGASPWQLRTFGCLAWFESRNNPWAVSPTGDYGILQINRRFHAWRWAGRDIFDPIVNAEVAWDIYRESGFRAWMTARLCGV